MHVFVYTNTYESIDTYRTWKWNNKFSLQDEDEHTQKNRNKFFKEPILLNTLVDKLMQTSNWCL